MSARHTEGPYRVAEGEVYAREIIARSPRGKDRVIARVPNYCISREEANATARLFAAAPAMLAALEAQVEADRLSGIYQTYADAPTSWDVPDYDSRCEEMHAAWMQAQDLAEKLRDAALSAARGDGKGEA